MAQSTSRSSSSEWLSSSFSSEESTGNSLVPANESLCYMCKEVFERADYPPFYSSDGEHHKKMKTCRQAASEGCFICSEIWNAIMKLADGKPWRYSHESSFTEYGISNSGSHAPIGVRMIEYYDHAKDEICTWKPGDGLLPNDSRDPSNRWLATFSFFNFGYANDWNRGEITHDCTITFAVEPTKVVNSKPIINSISSISTNCDEVWKLTSSWLDDCLGSHALCNTSDPRCPVSYPTRLLDLGTSADSTIKLRETTKYNITGPYVALSHCWGTSQMTVLTKQTTSSDENKAPIPIQTFQEGIDQERLPRTFRDAIFACRKFNVRYLWIDALCIIQDSKEDWRIESAKMHNVYSRAFLTLAADASSDNAGGLFQIRDPLLVSPAIVRPTWEGATAEDFFVIPIHFWKYNVADSPLNQRAWVLQERYLSPRVLHFGKNQVLWECRTHDCCETFPDRLPTFAEDLHTRFKGVDFEIDGGLLRRTNIDEKRELDEEAPDGNVIDMEEEAGSDQSVDESVEPSSRPSDDEDNNSDEFDWTQIDRQKSGEMEKIYSEDGEADDTDRLKAPDATPEVGRNIVSGVGKINLDEVKVENQEATNDDVYHSDEAQLLSQSREASQGSNLTLNGYYIWCRLLEKYCRSKLTKESDRLVAISGLAQAMQAQFNDTYLAGLWKNILPSQLLWRVERSTPYITFDAGAMDDAEKVGEEGKEPFKRSKQGDSIGARPGYRRAPSWSWASIEGPIATSRPSRAGSLIRFTSLSLGDGIQTVEPALLVVDGDLHVARLQYMAAVNHWTLVINKRGKRVHTSQRRFKGATADPKFFPDCQEEWTQTWPISRRILAIAYPDTTPPDSGALIMCMPIQRRRRSKALQPEELSTDNERIGGLMLMPHPDPGGLTGVYQRIGMFESMSNPEVEHEKETLGFGEEYCYSDDNKQLFSPGPMGYSETVLLN